MHDGKSRFCDVCENEIPKNDHYRRVHLTRPATELLASPDDPNLIPTWTQNPDGTVNMDICLTCSVAMSSTFSSEDKVN